MKKAKKQKLAWNGEVLTIEFPSIGKKLAVDVSQYNDDVRHEAMLHGFKQKFGDAKSGKSAAEKYADVQSIHAALTDGDWARTATPDFRPIVALAISRLQKLPLPKVEEQVNAASDAEFAEWKNNKKVRAEIKKIEAERLDEEAEDAEDFEFTLNDE